MRNAWAHYVAGDPAVDQACVITNLSRLRWLAPVLLLTNIAHIAVFLNDWVPQSDLAIDRWRLGIALSHGFMGVVMAITTALVVWARRQPRLPACSIWIGRGSALGGLLAMISIVAVDQLVTPNITPFVLGSLVISIALLMPPRVSLQIFTLAAILFWITMGLHQTDAAQLLSNRVNGITTCVMALALSHMLYRGFARQWHLEQRLMQAHDQLLEKNAALDRLARHDSLTGLYNRTGFLELARREIAQANRQGVSTGVIVLDLDWFKNVNDTWGHPAGDATLMHLAAVLAHGVRATDLIGRMGGEEFVILLPRTSLEATRKLAEKLRLQVMGEPTAWQDQSISVTFSAGTACALPDVRMDFESLYAAADRALFDAKRSGRNRVV
jgi:diguanylate cyclase (GGDEF)-like protein